MKSLFDQNRLQILIEKIFSRGSQTWRLLRESLTSKRVVDFEGALRLLNSRHMDDASPATSHWYQEPITAPTIQYPSPETTSFTQKRLSLRRKVLKELLTGLPLALLSAVLLVLSFPDFNFWPLAWIALVPLLITTARRAPASAFLLGWLSGSTFFYASCHWLTYSMVHYGHIPSPLAYLLLIPGALLLGVFPALFATLNSWMVQRWGVLAILISPLCWSALEWARLGLTGQLWNALGYSQAYQPLLIGPARWGGVYAVGFAIAFTNALIALVYLEKSLRAVAGAVAALIVIAVLTLLAHTEEPHPDTSSSIMVVALQPNVPMDPSQVARDREALIARHLTLSEQALKSIVGDNTPRLVVWPESPMNFSYAGDKQFQSLIANFTSQNHTALLLNSQEPAPNDGFYNSAILINEEGRLAGQYDKIRLMPFGEYVPLPHWVPGASLITGLVGDFTPGTRFTLLPFGNGALGVFICIEAAYPNVARTLSAAGADVLINISNDGYLGPTAVMKQHLANAIFRAVENGRPLLRITNTGITASISANGELRDTTQAFVPAVRVWKVSRSSAANTFYTQHGDLFVAACALLSALLLIASFISRTKTLNKRRSINWRN